MVVLLIMFVIILFAGYAIDPSVSDHEVIQEKIVGDTTTAEETKCRPFE